jgi:TRAP-type C4-dicarboxylate transport system substrate-binding protein
MNMDKWNKLPADIQKIIEGTLEPWEKKFHADALAEDKAVREKLLASPDHKVIDPTPAELALWTAKARPSHKVWIKQMRAKGLPAQAAYDKLMEIIASYK